MPKRIQRQYLTRGDEECAREIADNKTVSKRREINSNNTPKEAGANMANSQVDQEILVMLKQINEQLKQMQPQQNRQNSSAQNQQFNQTENKQNQDQAKGLEANEQNEKQNETIISEELSKLFSQLVKGKPKQTNSSINEQTQAAPESNNTNQGDKRTKQSNQEQDEQRSGTVAVHTAAQVLAEAQYELANELDASLKKLKQVISESEKIANKISNLLGEGNASNKQ